MFQTVRDLIRDNPVRVRAAVGALLVLVGQYVPVVKEMAGSEGVVDAVTLVVLLVLGESASRKVAAKYGKDGETSV
ncbi:hypothetical protein [Streptomyces sp. MNP-20]|uniref:hypothetical protein n=1 Tax=Streptomyces sp. MNP-20 TaxID=2721165 RepID=UPI00155759A9|nr:hypothetical protein [Streptomyces sp. MNP-20]